MRHAKLRALNKIPNKMIINGDVLHAGVKDWISTKIRGANVITVNGRWRGKGDPKFSKQRPNLLNFRRSSGNRYVFRFSRGAGHRPLLLRALGNGVRTKKENICPRRCAIVRVSSPASIGETV